eukprot:11076273-Heterocapsa_arctica.AAC.1
MALGFIYQHHGSTNKSLEGNMDMVIHLENNLKAPQMRPSYSKLNWLQLKAIRTIMNAEPQCLWAAGVITKYWTALPEAEYMKETDISQACTAYAKKNASMDRPPKLAQ